VSLTRRVALKPGKPLKRTPFRSSSVLTARTGLERRTRMKPRSDKTARRYVTRRRVVAALLAERPWCEIRWDRRCQRRSVDVHEPGMRSRGADICDRAQCTASCRYCHDQVHLNPAEATRRGWMIPSGQGRCAA
jgi:hypothetical protein